LVHGFEVPIGLSEPKAFRSFIDFEITAPLKKLKEFYLGSELSTKRRFSERRYVIDEGKTGFEVWHTPESLRRLGLDQKYARGHIFITNRHNRTQTLRIHFPPEPGSDLAREFVPDISGKKQAQLRSRTLEAATSPSGDGSATGGATTGGSDGSPGSRSGALGSGSGSDGGGAGGSKPGHSGSSGAGEEGSGAPAKADGELPKPPTGAQTADIRSPSRSGRSTASGDAMSQAEIARKVKERYGPYPPNRRRDARPLIRNWQLANPGKTFLD